MLYLPHFLFFTEQHPCIFLIVYYEPNAMKQLNSPSSSKFTVSLGQRNTETDNKCYTAQ